MARARSCGKPGRKTGAGLPAVVPMRKGLAVPDPPRSCHLRVVSSHPVQPYTSRKMPVSLSFRMLLLAPLVGIAVLAGCQTPPPRTFPDISFANRGPIELDVAQIEVVQRYRPPQ